MITIIGAGKVGGSAALHSAIKQLDDQILLLDVVEGLPQGEAMDLNHLLSEQGIDVEISGSNNYEDMKGSDIVVVVAGAGRKPGMTRMDLLKINAGVVKDVVGNIKKYADNSFVSYFYELGFLGVFVFSVILFRVYKRIFIMRNMSIKLTYLGFFSSFILLNLGTMPLWQMEGIMLFSILMSSIYSIENVNNFERM